MIAYLLQIRYRSVPILEAIAVERATASSVWIDGKRQPRESFRGTYYDTAEQAHAAAIAYGESRVHAARGDLQRANDFLGAAKGLLKHRAKAP